MNTALPSRGQAQRQVSARLKPGSPRWLIYYYIVQIICQLALLTDWLSSVRVLLRSSAYGMSLVALVLTASRPAGKRQPAAPLAVVVLGILALETLHPETSSPLAALATVAMYAAILGPLFWVPRLAMDASWFRRVVLMIWAFQSLSALFGAMQVYYPDVFHTNVSTLLSDSYLVGLQITLSNGQEILRPSGLSDLPGGAAVAGTYAILLALGLWADRPAPWFRALLAVSMAVGMFALYICEIRSLVVMVAISILATAAVHARMGRLRSFLAVVVLVGVVAVVAFVAAVSVGGDDVSHRLLTLTEGSPTDVYYSSRGIFLEHTVTSLLPEYPLGAGLGRWGMISNYFGGGIASFIYVEIQWTGWLLDGGVLLMFVYSVMLAVTVWAVWRVARRAFQAGASTNASTWAAVLIGYDVGTIALTFNFPAFMSNFGMDFWLLNTALLVVAAGDTRESPNLPGVDVSTAARVELGSKSLS